MVVRERERVEFDWLALKLPAGLMASAVNYVSLGFFFSSGLVNLALEI